MHPCGDITREHILRMITACHDAQWRFIFSQSDHSYANKLTGRLGQTLYRHIIKTNPIQWMSTRARIYHNVRHLQFGILARPLPWHIRKQNVSNGCVHVHVDVVAWGIYNLSYIIKWKPEVMDQHSHVRSRYGCAYIRRLPGPTKAYQSIKAESTCVLQICMTRSYKALDMAC